MKRIIIILNFICLPSILYSKILDTLELDSNTLRIECLDDIKIADQNQRSDYLNIHLCIFNGIELEKAALKNIFKRNHKLQKLTLRFSSKINLSELELELSNINELAFLYFKDPDQVISLFPELNNLKVLKFIQCNIGNILLDSIKNDKGNLKGIQFFDCKIVNNNLKSLNKLNLNWLSIYDDKIKTISCELLNNKNLIQLYLIYTPNLVLPKCAIRNCIKIETKDESFKKRNRSTLRKLKKRCRKLGLIQNKINDN
jgi:hypothetical protein